MAMPHPEGGTATAVATQTEQEIDQRLLAVDVDEARTYLAFLNEKAYSKATIARKLATLRSFYKFLVKTNRVQLESADGDPHAEAGQEAAALPRIRGGETPPGDPADG